MSKVDGFVPLRRTYSGLDYGERAVVMTPSIQLDEIRTVPGELIPGSGNPKAPCHRAELGPCRYAHQSRHLCAQVSVGLGLPRRDLPVRQEVSVALRDVQRDWDFLERHRDLVFDNKRIQAADPVWDKVRALAEDIWKFRRVIQKPGGNDFSKSCPWSHPVDTLIYGSWCLGGAYALVGLCATLGVSAREVSMWGHSGAEVWLGGQWCYVDSIQRFPEAGGCNMVRASFAEIVLAPGDDKFGFCDEQKQMYWQTWLDSCRSAENGLWQHNPQRTVFCPQTALALYPNWNNPRFKSDDEYRYTLVPGMGGCGGFPELILRQGQAFQRRFWVGSLAETEAIKATFSGSWNDELPGHQVPADGGNWFIAVNDRVCPVRDQGGWDFHQRATEPKSGWMHQFTLPLDALRENAWNTLAVGCAGAGNEFLCFKGDAQASMPEEPCFCAEVNA